MHMIFTKRVLHGSKKLKIAFESMKTKFYQKQNKNLLGTQRETIMINQSFFIKVERKLHAERPTLFL